MGVPNQPIKNFRKKSHSAEKNWKGEKKLEDPSVSFGFVCYVEKKTIKGTLCTKLPLAVPDRSSSLVVLVISVKSGPFSVKSVA